MHTQIHIHTKRRRGKANKKMYKTNSIENFTSIKLWENWFYKPKHSNPLSPMCICAGKEGATTC